ncbi:MAG: helix-turn-helix domain-containing protein [Desulfurococcaceae archaeon]|nr:helix-turn-helix domain-containing protein [Desulfurococcaceae archaeon]
MEYDFVLELIAQKIAGDIVMSENCGASLRKWREVFKLTQTEVGVLMGVSASVISDYEKGRRSPGVKFVRRFVKALINLDKSRGYPVVKQIASSLNLSLGAIMDLKDFSVPMKLDELVTVVEGFIANSNMHRDVIIYGYTVLDSLEAIERLSGNEFWQIMGATTRRALIFTKVSTGRSPMISVRVSPVKPVAVVLHGTKKIDPLAIRLADREGLPLIVSLKPTAEDLIKSLRKWFSEREEAFTT